MNNIFIFSLIILLSLSFPIAFSENEVSNQDILDELSTIESRSKIVGLDVISFGVLSLAVSIIIATGLYVRTLLDAKGHTKDLKESSSLLSLHQEGNFYYNTKDYENALQHYEDYDRIKPNNVKMLHSIGATLERLDRWNDSIPYYQRILETNPTDQRTLSGTYNNLGLAYEKIGQYHDSAFAYYEGLRADPHNHNILVNLGILYRERFEKYNWAHFFFDVIIFLRLAHGKDLSQVFVNKGLAFYKQKEFDDSLEMYNQALKLDKENSKALNGKAGILYHKSEFRESLLCSNLALKIDPKSYVTLLNKGNALMDLGYPNESLSCIDEYLLLHPEDHKAFLNKGIVYARYGDHTKAVENFEKGLKFVEGDIAIYGALMQSYMNLGDFPAAIETGQRALKIDNSDIGILSNIGACYCHLQDYETAIFCYFYPVFQIEPRNLAVLRNMNMAFARLNDFPSANLCWDTYQLVEQHQDIE